MLDNGPPIDSRNRSWKSASTIFRPVLPFSRCPPWKRPSATCWPCPARASPSWRSATARSVRTDHRAGRSQPPHTAGHPRKLSRPLPARGALLQFGMVPMNFLRNTGKPADYIVTGTWSKKAVEEAKTQGTVRTAWDGKATQLQPRAQPGELKLDPGGRLRLHDLERDDPGRAVPGRARVGGVPLVCDASSRFPLPAGADREATASSMPAPRRTPARRA